MSTPEAPTVWRVDPDYPAGHPVLMTDAEVTQWQADRAAEAAAAAAAAPATPDELAAVPAAMAAQNLAATFSTIDEVAATAAQLHAEAKAGIANFKADIAAWDTLTDEQKLSHVLGLMQAMVPVLQNLTGDFS